MSYIKIMFPDGIERGLKFNNLAVREFWKNIDILRFDATANYSMVWAGLVGNAYAKQEDIVLTFEQVIDLCDKMSQDDINAISEVLAAVQSYKDGAEKIQQVVANETEKQKKSELKSSSKQAVSTT